MSRIQGLNCWFQYPKVLSCFFLKFKGGIRCSDREMLNRSKRLTLLTHRNNTVSI